MSCGETALDLLKIVGYIVLMRVIWGVIYIILDVTPRCKTYSFLNKAQELKEKIDENKVNMDIADCTDYFYKYHMTSYDDSGMSEDKRNGVYRIFCKPRRYTTRVGKIIIPCRITGIYEDGPSVTFEVKDSLVTYMSIITSDYYL